MSLSFSTLSAVACGVWASAKSPRPKSCGFRDTTFPAYDLETTAPHTVTRSSLTPRGSCDPESARDTMEIPGCALGHNDV